jgi:hypothetical protein
MTIKKLAETIDLTVRNKLLCTTKNPSGTIGLHVPVLARLSRVYWRLLPEVVVIRLS